MKCQLRKIFCTLLLLNAVIKTYGTEEENTSCYGLNEEYKSCGTTCPDTCDNYMNSRSCKKICVSGCFCKSGYVRHSNNLCVLPDDCPKKAEPIVKRCSKSFEEYKACGPGCPNTCKFPIANMTCTKQCAPGCFCQGNYIRNNRGRCVLPEDCPSKGVSTCANDNEEYLECGTGCQLTCETYGSSFECPDDDECVPGCYCEGDLVKDHNGDCIRPELCDIETVPDNEWIKPNRCKKSHEIFRYTRDCHLTCKNYHILPKNCIHKEVMGCYCEEGYVRDDDQNCILPDYCPIDEKCRKDLSLLKSPFNKYLDPMECSMENTCRITDKEDLVIPLNFTPIPDIKICNSIQEVYTCGSPCDTRCSTLGLPCNKFSFKCVKQCYCKKGFARDHRNKCIPLALCPRSCVAVIPALYRLFNPQKK